MKLVVLVKIVPDTETRFQLQPDGSDVVWDSSIEYIISPYDEYAIEEAIQLKEKNGGEVISVTIAKPGIAEKSIRKAMAMGVDEGILIEDEALANSDPLTLSKAIAELVQPLGADLVLTGKMATDSSESFVGPAIAQILGLPVMTELSELEVAEGKLKAMRSAGGRHEKFEANLPAVITADKGLNDPRYPKLPDIMKAKKKPLHKDKSVSIASAQLVKQVGVAFPPEKGGGKKIEGTADEVVSVLVDGLANQEKVI